ncbi:MAG: arylamine N-acetyltransferase [Ginsengibacter sp.]
MNPTIDLKSYFQRVGYEGTPTNSLDTLRQLHRLHTQAIAFENINPFLGIPVKLDIDSLKQKLIHDGRGGYCFEQNLLFKHVLEAVGFSVKGLAARVLWNQPQDIITRRSHMLLLINYNDTNYIADVGFGATTLSRPMLLEPDIVQQTRHEPYRLVMHEEGYYFLQAEIHDEWKTLYRFDLEEQFLPDYEMANWYVSNRPESSFVNGLMVARADSGRRYTLNNNVFKVHLLGGKTESQTLSTVGELQNILENEFQLNLLTMAGIDEILQQKIFSK